LLDRSKTANYYHTHTHTRTHTHTHDITQLKSTLSNYFNLKMAALSAVLIMAAIIESY